MDYVQKAVNRYVRKYNRGKQINYEPLISIIKPPPNMQLENVRQGHYYEQCNRIIELVRDTRKNISHIYSGYDEKTKAEKEICVKLANDAKQDCINYIETIACSDGAMYLLLKAISKEQNSDIARFMFEVLFGTPNKQFFKMIIESRETLCELVEWENGNIPLYDYLYYKQKIS